MVMKDKRGKRLELDLELIADLEPVDDDQRNVRGGVSKVNCATVSASPTQSCFSYSGGI